MGCKIWWCRSQQLAMLETMHGWRPWLGDWYDDDREPSWSLLSSLLIRHTLLIIIGENVGLVVQWLMTNGIPRWQLKCFDSNSIISAWWNVACWWWCWCTAMFSFITVRDHPANNLLTVSQSMRSSTKQMINNQHSLDSSMFWLLGWWWLLHFLVNITAWLSLAFNESNSKVLSLCVKVLE